MKILRILITIMTALICVPLTHAVWQVIDDFETTNVEDILTWNNRVENTIWGQNFIVTPEVAETDNDVFYSDAMHSGEELSIIYSKWVLPGSGVVQGSTATLYFRFFHIGPDHNVNIGLSDIAPITDAEDLRPNAGTMAYGDFETQVLFDNLAIIDDMGTYAVRDGGTFVATETAMPNDTWIHIWVVVSNNVQDGVTVFDESTLYVQPEGGDQMLVPIPDGAGGTFDTFLFRNQTDDPLVAFFVGNFNDTGAGGTPNPNEQWYIDNVQIDYDGENLTVPTNNILGDSTDMWGPYPVIDDGWVDTGSFLQWINVVSKPWIYSLSLGKYLYLPEENLSGSGAWGYVPN